MQDGSALGGGALPVDAGEGVRVGLGGVQDQDPYGVGVVGAAAATGFGETQLPGGDGPVGPGAGGCLVQGAGEPGAGGFGEVGGEVGAEVVQGVREVPGPVRGWVMGCSLRRRPLELGPSGRRAPFGGGS